jgi:hypothetical protein
LRIYSRENGLFVISLIIKESWNTATNAEDRREKIQALSLAKECYSMKLDLLINATVVDGSEIPLMANRNPQLDLQIKFSEFVNYVEVNG